MYFRLTLFCLLAATSILLPAQDPILQRVEPMRSEGQFLGAIPALRDLQPHTRPETNRPPKLWQRWNYFAPNALNNTDPLPRDGDPLVHSGTEAESFSGPQITPLLNFEGLSDQGVIPPDPSGDIGKNHYFQMVNSNGNSWFQIWNKQGQSVYGPALTSTIWSQVGSGSIGDPIVQYDPGAERWVIMEMQGFGNNELLLAISDDSDPTGSWKAYRFATLGFPDYPKLYVWPDAYLITVNEIVSGSNKSAGFAIERSAVLAGAPSFGVYRFEFPNFQSIAFQPSTGADWGGGPPPPPGSPGYVFRMYDDAWNGGADQLQVWEIHLNWQNIGQSFTQGPKVIYTAPFESRVCWGGLFDCIEQPGAGSTRITALENILMYRAAYRRFDTHETVVLNHVSDVSGMVGNGGDAAVRWYELRKEPGSDWAIYQQGTYSPDLTNRFMGTLDIDAAGNIGLGYSVASTSVFPGLRLTGRRAGDPLNEMTIEEYTLKNGEKSHSSQRWGDYSSMTVDPEDGRTFWFTGEYQPAQGLCGTRIGSFIIQRDTYDVAPQHLIAPVPSAQLGSAELVSVEILNSGLQPAWNIPVSLIFDGNLVATEVITDTIQPGAGYVHTFSPSVAMEQPGQTYMFEVYTAWSADVFLRNDTLNATVRKPTLNDVAAAGRSDLPGLVCSANHTFGFILGNAAGLPLESAELNYRVNAQPWQTINWTGYLEPGQYDTIPISMTNLNNGLNGLILIAGSPNGVQDEDGSNDTLLIKFYGNLSGSYVAMEGNTVLGNLHWEVRAGNNLLVAQGDLTGGAQSENICSANEACYTVTLRATTFSWEGDFRLYDLYGNLLVQVTQATTEAQSYEYCAPTRKQQDVGALELITPVSGPNLGSAEPVRILFRNFGLQAQSAVELGWQTGAGDWHLENVNMDLEPGGTFEYTFNQTADLSIPGAAYPIQFRATLPSDEAPENDLGSVTVWHRVAVDAALRQVRMSQACSDTGAVQAALDFFNNGLDSILELQVEIILNGVSNGIQTLDANLEAGDSITLYLPVSGALYGNNTVSVAILSVNGQGADGYSGNNLAAVDFQINPASAGIGFELFLDANPQQTTWELLDAQDNVLYSGGPYNQALQFQGVEWCLQPDSCYTFRLYDAGGDGMNGTFNIRQGDSTLFSFFGIPFTDVYTYAFCPGRQCAGFDLQATPQAPSGSGINDGSITVLASGGIPPFTYALDGGTFQDVPLFSGLTTGTYALECRDASGCSENLLVVLGSVGTSEVIAQPVLQIAPNPSPGLVWISMDAVTDEPFATVVLYDQHGRMMQTGRMHRWDGVWRGVLAVETYPAGTYRVVVRCRSGVVSSILVKSDR